MAFKKHLHTQIHLSASPQQVWQVLTDTSTYSDWNPFITQLTGQLVEGQSITVQIQNMQFKPTLLTCQAHQELRWLGKLWIKGLFDGEHIFRLVEQADGSTLFHQEEYFSGLLVPLLAKQLDQQTKTGFEAMNQALSDRLEALRLSI